MWPFKRGVSDKDYVAMFGELWSQAQDAASKMTSEIQKRASEVGEEPLDLESEEPASESRLPTDFEDKYGDFSIWSRENREGMHLIDMLCAAGADRGIRVAAVVPAQKELALAPVSIAIGIEVKLRKVVPRNEAYREIHDTFHSLIVSQCRAYLMWVSGVVAGHPDRSGPPRAEEHERRLTEMAGGSLARAHFDEFVAARLRGRLKRLAAALPESDPIRSIMTE